MPTFRGNVVNGQILIRVRISKARSRANDPPTNGKAFTALVDTGATLTAINQKVVNALSLKPSGTRSVMGVHGEQNAPTYMVGLSLPIATGSKGEPIIFETGKEPMEVSFPRPTISLDSDLRNCIRSYRRGGTRDVQRKKWRRWGREGSPEGRPERPQRPVVEARADGRPVAR